MRKREELNLAYLEALKEMKCILDNTDKMSIDKLIQKYKLSNELSKVVVKEKLILRTGDNPKRFRYNWNTIQPNLKMANKCREKCNESCRKQKIEKSPKLKKQNKTPLDVSSKQFQKINVVNEKESQERKELSIFWGLFKMKF